MEIYEIIYNSSQTNRSGGVGFGIRSVTEGLDQDLLTAISKSDVFAYGGATGTRLSPDDLLADPTQAKQFLPEYCFRKIESGPKNVWILGRKIGVGFDYSFYEDGVPTRLGNYVGDFYLFDSAPNALPFDLMFENPAPGAEHFIPSSNLPDRNNEEMKAISLGKPSDMPRRAMHFNALSAPQIGADALELYFAYIEARQEKKPLMVKAAEGQNVTAMLASFMKLLPSAEIANATFTTNYNKPGAPTDIAIVVASDNFRFQIMPTQWKVLDFKGNAKIDTPESRQFRELMMQAIQNGDAQSLAKISDWIFSPTYQSLRHLKDSTNRVLYLYLQEPEKFTAKDYDLLFNDSEIQSNLAKAAKPEQLSHLNRELDSRIKESQGDVNAIGNLLDLCLLLKSNGIPDMVTGKKENQLVINQTIFANPESFLAFYHRVNNLDSLKKYEGMVCLQCLKKEFNREANCNSFLSSYKDADWKVLYPLFFSFPIEPKEFAKRAFLDPISKDLRAEVLAKEIERATRMELYAEILKKESQYDQEVAALLAELQQQGVSKSGPSLFETLNARKDNPLFTQILMTELTSMPAHDNIEAYAKRVWEYSQVPTLAPHINKSHISKIVTAFKNQLNRGGREHMGKICDTLLKSKINPEAMTELALINDYVNGHITPANGLDLQRLAIEHNCITDLKNILGQTIARPDQTPQDIAAVSKVVLNQGFAKDRNTFIDILIKYNTPILEKWVNHLYSTEKKIDAKQFVSDIQAIGQDKEFAESLLRRTWGEEAYNKYIKSLQPSVISKIKTFILDIFSKKKALEGDEQQDQSTPKGEKPEQQPRPSSPKSKRQQIIEAQERKYGPGTLSQHYADNQKPAADSPRPAKEGEHLAPHTKPAAPRQQPPVMPTPEHPRIQNKNDQGIIIDNIEPVAEKAAERVSEGGFCMPETPVKESSGSQHAKFNLPSRKPAEDPDNRQYKI